MLVNGYRDEAPTRFEISEIANDGKRRVLHELKLPAELGDNPVPESRDSFLLVDWKGVLRRIDTKTGKNSTLREIGLNVPDGGHLSPAGDYLVAFEAGLYLDPIMRDFGSPPTLVPLDPKKPCVTLDGGPTKRGFRPRRARATFRCRSSPAVPTAASKPSIGCMSRPATRPRSAPGCPRRTSCPASRP